MLCALILMMAVSVPVVYGGIVRMTMRQPLMQVWMRVRLSAVPGKSVRVLMMLVVHVAMRVRRRFVRMRVFVAFSEMEPDATGHERGGDPEWHRCRFTKGKNCNRCPNERCSREIGTGAC